MKLFIYDEGDNSVGIFPYNLELDCPFERNEVDKETLKWFKEQQYNIYKECLDNIIAIYDFEFENGLSC